LGSLAAIAASAEVHLRFWPPEDLKPFLGEESGATGPFVADPDFGYTFRSFAELRARYAGRLEELVESADPRPLWAFFGNSFVQAPRMLADTARATLRERRIFHLGRNEPLELALAEAAMLLDNGLRPERLFVLLMPVDCLLLGPRPWSLPYVYLYALQIYLDFSAYTDIARGLALFFGFRWPENFHLPYLSASIPDFWRRWHVTLSRFLRDYVYVPLGGSRRGRGRTAVNLMITMLLGGLWHGATWSFLLWGGVHGAMLLGHRAWTGDPQRVAGNRERMRPAWSRCASRSASSVGSCATRMRCPLVRTRSQTPISAHTSRACHSGMPRIG
jgi:hypothetical protein